MRRTLAVILAAIGSAGAWTIACTTFDASPDAATDAEGGTADGAARGDAGTAGDAATIPLCAMPVDRATATFDDGKAAFMFQEAPSPGGRLAWNETGGPDGSGALEAFTTITDVSEDAQIERDFPLRGATRARLSFATRSLTIPSDGYIDIGCVLELVTEPVDGGTAFIAISFLLKNGELRFDQGSRPNDFASIPSVTITAASTDWHRFTLEMNDITSTTVSYRAFYEAKDVTPVVNVVPLPAPPRQFHVKCGIDSADVTADVLVDDVSFEMCTP